MRAAFDRAQDGADHAAAVGGHHGGRVEETDEGCDVLGLPCLFDLPHHVGATRSGSGSLRPVSVQVVLGIAHVPSVHLPLGVLMFGMSVLALARR